MGDPRKVVRSDGARYRSLTEAAYAVAAEQGTWDGDATIRSMVACIQRVCSKKYGNRRTAFGYGWRYAKMPHKQTQFALYRGDELLDVGTAYEIAERRGILPSSVKFWASPSNRKRIKDGSRAIYAVRLEDE